VAQLIWRPPPVLQPTNRVGRQPPNTSNDLSDSTLVRSAAYRSSGLQREPPRTRPLLSWLASARHHLKHIAARDDERYRRAPADRWPANARSAH
jgi:hypothetical protein